MSKVDPYIIAIKVHAGSAHVKRIVSALNLAGVLMVHSVVLIIPTGQMLETATTACCLCLGLLI
jgi:hypothetical protein